MENLALFLLALVGGIGVSLQTGINGELGKRVGSIEGSFISFLVGLVALTIIMLFAGKGNLMNALSGPKWQLTGGLFGAFYVFMMVMLVPRLGVGASLITAIVGQIIMSLTIDSFGWFGKAPVPVTWQRLLGAGLMVVALFLIFGTSTAPSAKAALPPSAADNDRLPK